MSCLPTIQIEFGDIGCAILCHDRRLYGQLSQQFINFLSEKPPGITIELQVIDGISIDEVNDIMPRIRIRQEGKHFTADELVLESDFSVSKRFITIKAERSFFNPKAEFKLMNRLLTLAYYTVCHWNYDGPPSAMVVHSSGIVRRKKALLFIGPSGAGKTTVASLCDNDLGQIINDEMTLVTYPRSIYDEISVQGIPILGELPERSNAEAPLKCVFSLKQSQHISIRRLSQVEAYLSFMKQIISPAYFGQTDRQALFSLITDFSDEITRTIPFYELEFSLDKESLWQVLDEFEGSFEEEEIKIG